MTAPSLAAHGAKRLPSVEVDSYNLETKDDGEFIGDRISKGAFRELIETWRKVLRKKGDDPFGDTKSEDLTKQQLDKLLGEGDVEAAAVVQGAIEDCAKEFATVLRR